MKVFNSISYTDTYIPLGVFSVSSPLSSLFLALFPIRPAPPLQVRTGYIRYEERSQEAPEQLTIQVGDTLGPAARRPVRVVLRLCQ